MRDGVYGRSTIKLIFTILILAIVITGIVLLAQRLWEDNSVKDVETDLLYIKGKCKAVHDKNIIDQNEQLFGEKITEYPENEEVNQIISSSDKWYKLAQADLEAMGMGTLNAEDGYLVNYDEEDIIYAKGIERDKEIYYKLSDLQKLQAEEQNENNTISNETEEQSSSQDPATEVLEGHDTVETNE